MRRIYLPLRTTILLLIALTLIEPLSTHLTSSALAAPATQPNALTEFPIPTPHSGPVEITAGPDGNVWFTEFDTGKVGRITPSGQITEFKVPTPGKTAYGITAGPDGNVWFTITGGDTQDKIGKITPDGKIIEVGRVASHSGIREITAGPDGNLWFTEFGANKIGRITPQGTITEFSLPTPSSGPVAISAGPSGDLLFIEQTAGKVGRLWPQGKITEFGSNPGAEPVDVTYQRYTIDSDNILVAVHKMKALDFIYVPKYPGPGNDISNFLHLSPNSVAIASDQRVWCATDEDTIIRYDWYRGDPEDRVTAFPVTPGSQPGHIAPGPGPTVWFTEYKGNKIGRIDLKLTPPLPPVVPYGGFPGRSGQTFPETGKTVSGTFLDYWNRHGGLAQQGFPISEPMNEFSELDGKLYTVQYFERAVFESHLENRVANTKFYIGLPPPQILLSQLGTYQYKAKYPNGAPNQHPNISSGSQYFTETGHHVGTKFLDYWKAHGGLAQLGYPISDEFQEKSDLDGKVYTVQYFERAVFEIHPENAPPNDVLLSQLGTFRYKQLYPGVATKP